MNVLVVEDNHKLLNDIEKELKQHFEVTVSEDGLDAFYKISMNIYDIVVLDIMLPGMDGLSILKKMRKENIAVPVLMLTAKGEIEDKVAAFTLGANDYLTKPFYMEELVARIYALLRTNGRLSTGNLITYKDLVMDLDAKKVFINETELELQNKQFNLLKYFLVNKNIILLKEQIYDRIWGIDSDAGLEIVEVYISNLRKKLSPFGYDDLIKTKRGVGYIFECE